MHSPSDSSPRRLPGTRSTRAAFSLVELTAVMALITVIAGFSVPAMKGLTGSHVLASSASRLSGLLALARSEAIARHTLVRFTVEPTASSDQPGDRLRRVRLWVWETELGQFRPLTGWEELPVGVVLERELPDYIRAASYASDDAATVRGSYAFHEPETGVSSTVTEDFQGQYIEFLPSGSARLPGSSDRRIILVAAQGFADAQRGITYTDQTNGAPADWAQLNVDTLTGRTQIYRP